MLCENCNSREATVHRTKIVNGVKEEVHLCNECVNKNEMFNFDDNFSLGSFLSSLLEGNMPQDVNVAQNQYKRCPQCGYTYSGFKAKGRLGCSVCYTTFSDMLAPLIKKIQSSSTHIGKIPKKSGVSIKLHRKLTNLKNELQQLVMEEKFEEAAKVRDKIKELEGEIDNV